MANVLEKIVADKRIEVAERKKKYPALDFVDTLMPSRKSLYWALKEKHAGFIFECKKASPSKGLIREHFDLDEILAAYTPWAAGISVLTDEKYFQGSYDYLQYVTERVEQPVLNKDFFVSTYQVYLARHYNADAILLMLSVLDDAEYKDLAMIANALQLDILTEVSNEEEMERAIALEACIIGINNRNLRDLTTDLSTTERLVPMLEKATHDYVVISESGIYTHEEVQRLSAVSNGFLVGSALMAQDNLPLAVSKLIFGSTKVCGITRENDAIAAIKAGVTHLGFIFVAASPRCISLENAQQIAQLQPANYVGVFVDASLEEVCEHVNSLGLAAVQLHGNEDIEYRRALRNKLDESVEIWQACALSPAPTDDQLQQVERLLADQTCDRVLVDCKVGDASGGTGQQFDWQVLNRFSNKDKLVVAGGIGEDNIAAAAAYEPGMIDMNSKVEHFPGAKDQQAIARAMRNRRALAAHVTAPLGY